MFAALTVALKAESSSLLNLRQLNCNLQTRLATL